MKMVAMAIVVVLSGCGSNALSTPGECTSVRLSDSFDGPRIDATCWNVVGNASMVGGGEVLIDGRHGGPNLMESSAVAAASDFTLSARVRVVDNAGAPSLAFGWRNPDLAFLVPVNAPTEWHILIGGEVQDLDQAVPVTHDYVDLEINRHAGVVEFWLDGQRVRTMEDHDYARGAGVRFSAMGAGALLADSVNLN